MGQRHRFYVPDFKKGEQYQLLDTSLVHQCNKVLRLKSGDFVYFFRDNEEYKYQLSSSSLKSIDFKYIETIDIHILQSNITLYQAIPNKLGKLEYIVQKCSEVGVQKIVFFQSEYSQIPHFLTEKKKERLEKIAIEGAEQSGRRSVIKLVFEKKLNFSKVEEQKIICFHTDSNNAILLNSLNCSQEDNIGIFVGPEGGFQNSELESLRQKNAYFVNLGSNILRTETTGAVTSFFLIQKFYN